jgi:4-hydroxyphenylacetate 3-monooxygenase
MVEEYAAWYDRHLDPAWQELLLAPADAHGQRVPWAYVVPKGVGDLIGMGRSFAKTMFLSAGNVTHTPAYGGERVRRPLVCREDVVQLFSVDSGTACAAA